MTLSVDTIVIWHNGHEITSETRARILKELLLRGFPGGTTAELERWFGWDHGKVSGALSILHRDEHVVLLRQSRNKQGIYVASDYANGRPFRERITQHCAGCDGTDR